MPNIMETCLKSRIESVRYQGMRSILYLLEHNMAETTQLIIRYCSLVVFIYMINNVRNIVLYLFFNTAQYAQLKSSNNTHPCSYPACLKREMMHIMSMMLSQNLHLCNVNGLNNLFHILIWLHLIVLLMKIV